MKPHVYAIAALLTLLTAACNDGNGLLPRSGGRPYEVVVTGDSDKATALLGNILGALTAEVLPQQESAFDISVMKGGIGQTMKYARSIVIADTGADNGSPTAIRYEKNVYARPQIIIRVSTPSAEQLRADSARIQKTVSRLLKRFELNAEIARLKKSHNREAERVTDSIFGRRIWIAGDMQAMKTGKDFVWLSDNSATAMRNICIYSYPGSKPDASLCVTMRDSVMRANIPGRTPQMYMKTAGYPIPKTRMLNDGGRQTMELCGLWEMEGDAMGGPFISHSITDSRKGRIIVAEAFVFAPGKKKRDLIRQLEAALYTFK